MKTKRTKSSLFFQAIEAALAQPAQAAPASSATGGGCGGGGGGAGGAGGGKGLILTTALVLLTAAPGGGFAPPAEAKRETRCQDVFASSRSPLKPYLTENPSRPQAVALLNGYKIAQKKHWTGRKKELRDSEAGLLDFIRFLEKGPSPKERSADLRAAPVSREFLSGSLQKIPEITAFANQTTGAEGIVFQQTVQAVFALFSKHLPAAFKAKDRTKVNWAGLNAVLQSVAEFDIEIAPAFSLYKIRRAVKRQWALREFILCRR